MANGKTFWGLGTGAGGGPTPLTAGLMQLGQGMLAASTAPRAQRGALLAQAMNPQAMMQAKRQNDYYALLERMSNPVISEAPVTAGGVEPALGGSLVDLPGGGTAPGMVQTAMGQPGLMSPPAAPAAPPGPTLSPFQLEMLRAAGPQQGYGMLAQMMQPAKPQYMKGADGYIYNMTTGQRALPGVQARPKETSAMQNAAALGLERGTPEYDAYIRSVTTPQGTQVTIRNEGTIPPGFRVTRDAEGRPVSMEPIQGSPAQQEQAAAQEARQAQAAQRQRTTDIVTQDIDTILGQVDEGFPVTGAFSVAASVPGTKAHDVARTLDTIKANIGFDKLQAMRDASPTGGALGQVSERENVLLQSTYGSLAQSQTADQFKRNLRRLREVYLDTIHGKGNRPTGSAPAGQGVTIDVDQRLLEDPGSLSEEELRELAR